MYELIDLRKEKWNYDANSGSTGVYTDETSFQTMLPVKAFPKTFPKIRFGTDY